MENMRIPRDTLFMEICKLMSKRSTCLRAQVGSLLILDNRIISCGYNGAPSKLPHCTEEGCIIGETGGCKRCTHSESNCVSWAARHGIRTDGSILYCTMSPCRDCSMLLINAGVKEVIYLDKYRDTSGIDLLTKAGIKVTEYKEDEND